jgi:hypothetical protein
MRRTGLLVAVVIAGMAAMFGEMSNAFSWSRDHPAIEYARRPLKDPISELNRKLQDGTVTLTFDRLHGYLRSVLHALDVPIESQMLVFSKTSLQKALISPRNPRSIFFTDSVVVAWVRGEPFVEIAAQDPQQGVVFYTLNQDRTDKPWFTRRDDCLQCHESLSSLGVPGMLVRSVFTAPDGNAERQFGDYLSDHRSPLDQRWGGWYVTGKAGSARHLGNAVVTNPEKPESMVTNETLNLESLEGKFNIDASLSSRSDIAALMVFDHQMRMTNLLTRVGWEIRAALYQEPIANKQLYEVPLGLRYFTGLMQRDHTEWLLLETAKELVDYLLFIDEAPLAGKIHGNSGFAEKFAAKGPRDSKGRSLRQLDLERRLMRYPCSYMIYTAAFDALPTEAIAAIYLRMWQILSGVEKSNTYARLSLADRQAIVEILRETKKGLPDFFRAVGQ